LRAHAEAASARARPIAMGTPTSSTYVADTRPEKSRREFA
jgi:hypothetical protein